MSILSGGQTDFFGLDIGVSGIRVVQLRGSGKNKSIQHYGQVPIDAQLTQSDGPADRQKIAQSVKDLVKSAGISTKSVVANLPSGKVFTTVLDLAKAEPAAMAEAIRDQADSIIPTPLAESKIDWAVIGDSPKDPAKSEVLLSSVPNNFVEGRLDMLEAAGFNVVAFEPDNLAIARSLVAPDTISPQLVIDMGSSDSDLAVVMDGSLHLSRVIPVGISTLTRAASQNLGIQPDQAHQLILKFGVSRDQMEGKVYGAIINAVEVLMNETEKSIKFFSERYPNDKLERIIVAGYGSVLPNLPLYIANRFNLNVEIGNAWRNVVVGAGQQNELLAVSNTFAVAAGLAERE